MSSNHVPKDHWKGTDALAKGGWQVNDSHELPCTPLKIVCLLPGTSRWTRVRRHMRSTRNRYDSARSKTGWKRWKTRMHVAGGRQKRTRWRQGDKEEEGNTNGVE